MARILLFLCCFLAGCSGLIQESPPSQLETNLEDLDGICRRISKLNMTVVAPACGLKDRERLDMQYLATKYNLNIPELAFENKDILAGANTDEIRLKHFVDSINSDYDIIWAIRGGYSAPRLISFLNKLPIPRKNKTIVGYSDITSLNLFVSQKWKNWRVIHAPVLLYLAGVRFSKDKFETLLDILENKIDKYDINGIESLNAKAKQSKSVTGKLTGGNLSLIEVSVKTCWEVDSKNKIFFIEDVNEAPERVHRALYHLKEIGKLDNSNAIVFGEFWNAKNKKRMIAYLQEFAETLNVPVYITNQFGHGRYNMPLVYNVKAKISGGKLTVFVK